MDIPDILKNIFGDLKEPPAEEVTEDAKKLKDLADKMNNRV